MTQSIIARAVCGAVLATIIACGDSPTINAPTTPPAASPIANFTLTPKLSGGESTLRRSITLPDGRHFTVEGVRGADGLPRDLQISSEGVVIAQFRNEWRTQGNRAILDRQQFVRFADGVQVAAFDTRANGGVETVAGGAIALPAPSVIAPDSVVGFRQKRTTFSYLGDYASYGPCDSQARAVDAALDTWIYSSLGMAVGTATANPLMAYAAWAYQLKCWRDVLRAEAALDQCVESAGKPPVW